MAQRTLATLLLAAALAAAVAAAQDDDEVCYSIVGCFSLEAPWKTLLRPLPAPDSPDQIQARFYLFTRNQPTGFVAETRPEVSVEGSDFSGERTTVFITHGFASNGNTSWMSDMKDAMLQKVDANVFLTDWGPGASKLNYLQVAANTRVVAAELGRLLAHLIEKYDVKPQSVHLIGHSLGAQISSYVCKQIQNIGRLTALDPAQPGFEGFDRKVRLDASDAQFVEVLHTDAKPTLPLMGFGMMGAHGDVDYYVNGGFTQPGCLIPDNLPPVNSLADLGKISVEVISNFVSCPHSRSTQVFTEALRNDNCTFWGHPGNVVEKIAGAATRGYLHRYLTPSDEDCTVKSCSPVGLAAIQYPARGSFIVATTSNSPYCIAEPEVDGTMRKLLSGFQGGLKEVEDTVQGGITGLGEITGLGGLAKNASTFFRGRR